MKKGNFWSPEEIRNFEKQKKEDVGQDGRRRTKEIKRGNYLRTRMIGPERRRRAEKKKEDSIGKVKYLVLRRDEEQREGKGEN